MIIYLMMVMRTMRVTRVNVGDSYDSYDAVTKVLLLTLVKTTRENLQKKYRLLITGIDKQNAAFDKLLNPDSQKKAECTEY
jgi:hypothetical protein